MDKKNNFYKKSEIEKPKIIVEKLELEAKDLPQKIEVKKEEVEEPIVMELVLQEGEAKCDRCQMVFEERLAYKVGMAENIQWGEYQDNDKNITVSTAMKDLEFDTICDVCYNTSIDSNTGSISREWFD
jgi:hypothetical protein